MAGDGRDPSDFVRRVDPGEAADRERSPIARGHVPEAVVPDDRVARFGYAAGSAVLPAVALAVLLGPWRPVDLSPSAGLVPIVTRDSALVVLSAAVPVVVVVLLGLLAGALYRATTPRPADEHRGGMVLKMVEVQAVLAVVGYALAVVVATGYVALAASVLLAVGVFVAGVSGLLFAGLLEVVAVAVLVGVPAYLGVILGDGVGVIVRKLVS